MFSIAPLQESDISDMYQEIQRSRSTLFELGWVAEADWDIFYYHYNTIITQKKLSIFAIRVNNCYAGSVEVAERDDHYQIGYWLGVDYRKQGLATQSVKSVIDQLDPRPVKADTLITNQDSWRVLERLGFCLTHSDSANHFYQLQRQRTD